MAKYVECACDQCGATVQKETGHYNRSKKLGMRLFCNKACAGLYRKTDTRTPEQKRADKREYDANYRKTSPTLKQRRADYYKRTCDREKERQIRQARMPKHIEYCRRPEYKAWKREYDFDYRAREFGEFAEAYKATVLINREVKARMTNAEIRQVNGTNNKAKKRKQTAWNLLQQI